jgi:hypothetical protein
MRYRSRMRELANVLVPLAVIGVALAATPDSASAKCAPSMGTVLPDVHYVLDEVVVDREALDALDRNDILSVEVTCRDVTPEGARGRVLQNAIVMMSRSGAPALIESRLRDLVEAQHTHFAATGSYAATLEALEFPVSRYSHAIEISVSETGWSATSGSADVGTECRVAVGPAEGPPEVQSEVRSEARSGVVTCRAVGEG